MEPRRLLVHIDGTDEASAAVDVAVHLARGVNGTLTLLAVAPLAAPAAPGAVAGSTALEPQEQELLDRLVRENLDEIASTVGDGIDVRTALGWGPAGPAVVDEVEAGDHDLVVLPWRGSGVVGHLVHDHTARQVLAHSPVPVLVVPPAGTGGDGL